LPSKSSLLSDFTPSSLSRDRKRKKYFFQSATTLKVSFKEIVDKYKVNNPAGGKFLL
jgi:hypothetical protein